MPDWKTHLIFSLFLVIVWLYVLQFVGFHMDFEKTITIVIFSLFASLFPDIDMGRSKMRKTFSLLLSLSASLAYIFFFIDTWYYAPVYFALLYLILKYLPSKHRGITHTFKFSLLFSLVLSFLYSIFRNFLFVSFYTGFVVWFLILFSSYNLHLVIDNL